MKKTFLLPSTILLTIFLAAKTNAQVYHASLKTPKTFSQLPLVNTGKMPDLIFAGDSIPHNFIKTHVVELYYNYQASSNDLIKGIREKGMQEGVDGILLSGLGDNAPGTTSYSTARVFGNGQQRGSDYITISNGYAAIKGIGIKYIDRIDYLDTITKKREIKILGENGSTVNTVHLNYAIDGRLLFDGSGKEQAMFEDSIMPFDMQMALNLHSNLYEATIGDDENTGKPVIKKIAAAYGFRSADYHINDLDSKKMFRAIIFNNTVGTRKKYKVQPLFNDNNILVGANIFDGDKQLYQINYKLGLKNRIESEDWQMLVDGQPKPWLLIEDSYYGNEAYLNDFK